MGIAGDEALGQLCPGIQFVGIEVTELKAGNEQSFQATVEIGFLDVSTTYGLGQMLVFRAALHVGACQHGLGTGLGPVLGHIVPAGQEVADGAAVGGDQPVEAPFVAQDLLLVAGLGTAGLTVDTLIGAHDFGHLAFLHQGLEGRQVGLPEVALRQLLHIELVAVPLRTAVHGEVLGAGEELPIVYSRQFTVYS